MKNLRKIIALFDFIFVAGIFITVKTVNNSLNKVDKNQNQTTVEVQKDTLSLLKAEKKTV